MSSGLAPYTGPCPNCGTPCTAAQSCPQCGLDLTDPAVGELADLNGAIHALAGQRQGLLTRLRYLPPGQRDPAEVRPPPARTMGVATAQHLLVGLGALLVIAAAAVFGLVAWDRIGPAGQFGILVAVTVVFAAFEAPLRRRDLVSTATAVGVAALGLVIVDAFAARSFLGGDPWLWTAGTAALVAAICAAWTARGAVGLDVVGVYVAQVVAPAFAWAFTADLGVLAAALLVQAAVNAEILRAADFLREKLLVALDRAAMGMWFAGISQVAGHADAEAQWPVTTILLVVAAGCAFRLEPWMLTGSLLAATGTAGLAAGTDLPFGVAIGAVAAAGVAVTAPVRWREALVATGAAGVGLALILQTGPLATVLAGPYADEPVTDTASLGVVLVGAAAAAGLAVAAQDTRRHGLTVSAVGLAVAASLVPGVAGWSPSGATWWLIGVVLAGIGSALLARTDGFGSRAALGSVTVSTVIGSTWVSTSQTLAAVGAAILAAGCAVLATWKPWRDVAAAFAVVASVVAAALSLDLAGVEPPFVGLIGFVAGLAAAAVARRADLPVSTGAAALLAAIGAVGSFGDPDAASVTLAVVAAVAVYAGRRQTAWYAAGAASATALVWLRLDLAGVTVAEVYTAPAAALMLAAGFAIRARSPELGSWPAYGIGLGVAAAPTALLAVNGTDPWPRAVALLVGGLAGLWVGSERRLQAPLLVGAAAIVVAAGVALWPVAQAVPRWLLLGTTGVGLLVAGAFYERARVLSATAAGRLRRLQ